MTQSGFDPNFSFAPIAPIDLNALMALRRKNPGILGGVSQQSMSELAKAMNKWRQQYAGGQIQFQGGPDNDPAAGYYSGPQDTNAYGW